MLSRVGTVTVALVLLAGCPEARLRAEPDGSRADAGAQHDAGELDGGPSRDAGTACDRATGADVLLAECFDDDPFAAGRWLVLDTIPDGWTYAARSGHLESGPHRSCREWGAPRVDGLPNCLEGPAFVRSAAFPVDDGRFTLDFDIAVFESGVGTDTVHVFLHRADGDDPTWRVDLMTEDRVWSDLSFLVDVKTAPVERRTVVCDRDSDGPPFGCWGDVPTAASIGSWYSFHVELCGDAVLVDIRDRETGEVVGSTIGKAGNTIDASVVPFPFYDDVAVMLLAEGTGKAFDNIVVRRGADCAL